MNEVSGEFTLSVELGNEDNMVELSDTVAHFLHALELGLFSPAYLISETKPVIRGNVFEQVFIGNDVTLSCFSVLGGMLEYFSAVISTLTRFEASDNRQRRNLFDEVAQVAALPSNLPFKTHFQNPGGTAPPLLVSIQLRDSVMPENREKLLQEIDVWPSLVQGGYPREEDRQGESAMSHPSVRFNTDSTVQVSSEFWRASDLCFAPLFHLLTRWHRTGQSVDSVLIE